MARPGRPAQFSESDIKSALTLYCGSRPPTTERGRLNVMYRDRAVHALQNEPPSWILDVAELRRAFAIKDRVLRERAAKLAWHRTLLAELGKDDRAEWIRARARELRHEWEKPPKGARLRAIIGRLQEQRGVSRFADDPAGAYRDAILNCASDWRRAHPELTNEQRLEAHSLVAESLAKLDGITERVPKFSRRKAVA
jgi:hypothetical protein